MSIIPIGTIVLCLQTACFSTGLGLLFVARVLIWSIMPIGITVLCLRDSLFLNEFGTEDSVLFHGTTVFDPRSFISCSSANKQ
jgi:hypothetical protein